jgi:NAD(P)-dependent dehydrogenase (short-subunit alcohol dehydrogenase family)
LKRQVSLSPVGEGSTCTLQDEGETMMTMQGRICLITGGTNGIGKSTAMELARMGATVVIVGRNAEKTAQVVEDIRAASGNHAVDSLLADLSSQQEVRRLAEAFRGRYPQLHVLLNNAGATFTTRQLSVDGIEMTFALNHLAYFLLTNLLLDTLIARKLWDVSAEMVHLAASLDQEIPN